MPKLFHFLRPRHALPLLLLLGSFTALHAQQIAVKTNGLMFAAMMPNVGCEFVVGERSSIDISAFGAVNIYGNKAQMIGLMPEYRYWFCESFNGWFVGAHLMGGEFNASNVDMPFGLFDGLKEHRYEGWYAGGGLTVGYQWMLSRHWNIEASVGIGYDYIKYDKYECGWCGEKIKSSHSNYFGPTKAALSFLYIF